MYTAPSKEDNEICDNPFFLEFISSWAETHVTKPIKGFEQKHGTSGDNLTPEEQLDQTHLQVIHAAAYFYERGKPVDEIINILSCFER